MRSIILNIGTSCFVSCTGCYNHFASSVNNKNTVQNDEIISFVEKLQNIGVAKITIGGGDPLSRKELTTLVYEIKNRGIVINMDTVGTTFLKDAKTIFFGKLDIQKISIEPLIRNIDIIGIPLDGSNIEIASKFRTGRPDFFNEQIEIIDLLTEIGANVCVNTVLNKHNTTDIINIFQLLKNRKIEKWQIFQFMPIGPLGYKNQDTFAIEEEEFNKVQKQILSKSSKFNIEFKSQKHRKDNYLIIDDAGFAWIPKPNNRGRNIIGNIKQKKDVDKICSFLKKRL